MDGEAFLVLTGVILDMGKNGKQGEYQEHSEIRSFNTPSAAFINGGRTSGKEGERTGVEEE